MDAHLSTLDIPTAEKKKGETLGLDISQLIPHWQ
jgi:hypothetical protein